VALRPDGTGLEVHVVPAKPPDLRRPKTGAHEEGESRTKTDLAELGEEESHRRMMMGLGSEVCTGMHLLTSEIE
jgi:hypothetical protein